MRKQIRTRGKIPLSKYFQKLEKGDSVAVVLERSLTSNVPKRMQGRTGVIKGKQGDFQVVNLKDQSKEKTYLIHPVHLKKIKQ